jgi:hypothetical protein
LKRRTGEMADQIRCYFYAAEKQPGRGCEQFASGFVRVKHSGRLCPLCGPCKDSFAKAQSHMSDEARKALPGEASYDEVSLADGEAEYAAQPPKK